MKSICFIALALAQVVARASRPCEQKHTGETPMPLLSRFALLRFNGSQHGIFARQILALSACAALSGGSVRADTNAPAGMVVVTGGVFKPLFRSTADFKEVTVNAFCLDALPVTNEEFLRFVRANPRWQRSTVKRLFADESYLKNWAGDLELGTNALPQAPVTFVSWFAAKAYAQSQGRRLPTVAEWELVAAAGISRPDGENDPEFKKSLQTWYSTPSDKSLSAVGTDQSNYWGVHNMHGLVWEWVADFNTAMVTGDARGDTGLDRQLFCGSGSAGARDTSDYAAFMRYGFRSSLKADYCVHNLGFRCAKDL